MPDRLREGHALFDQYLDAQFQRMEEEMHHALNGPVQLSLPETAKPKEPGPRTVEIIRDAAGRMTGAKVHDHQDDKPDKADEVAN